MENSEILRRANLLETEFRRLVKKEIPDIVEIPQGSILNNGKSTPIDLLVSEAEGVGALVAQLKRLLKGTNYKKVGWRSYNAAYIATPQGKYHINVEYSS